MESKTALTVTRHDETLGVFVPAGARSKSAIESRSWKPTKSDIEAVRRAGAEMDVMTAAMGTTAEELIADFEKARREQRALRTRT